MGLHLWARWLAIFRHRLLKCGAPGGSESFPQLPLSLAAPLQQARHTQGTGKANIIRALAEGAAERSLLVSTQKPKTRTLQPLLFVEAIILCRSLRNAEQTTCKVTSFQIWIHSRTVVDNYQHFVICSRTLRQHLHHAHVRPWCRERLSWDSAALKHRADTAGQCQPSPRKGSWEGSPALPSCPWGQSQLRQAQADQASQIKPIQKHPSSWGQLKLLAVPSRVAGF